MPTIMTTPDELTRAKIVHMILNGKTEDALNQLSKIYDITPPKILVGTIKGKRRSVYAVYVQHSMRIYAMNSEVFYDPFVILHEFYHHLRTRGGEHRGTERHANNYAAWFITAYNSIISKRAKAA